MAATRDVVIVSGVRTGIGDFGGAFRETPPTVLGAACVKEAVHRAGVSPADVQHCVMGNIVHTDARDPYLARVVALEAGLPTESAALTLNRLCGSGLQAVVTAAQHIMLGDADIAVAGGAECMSRAGYVVPAARWGQKLGHTEIVDMLLATLHDPFGSGHMGNTAENLARKYGIGRDAQDAFAVESHARAARAANEGRFAEQIVPMEVKRGRETVTFAADEHVREGATLADMTKLRPVFEKDGTVTAGNASGINDGAAALVLVDAETADARGLVPMARIAGYAVAGVEPSEMGIGPAFAVPLALERAGIALPDVDVIECNEAFAVQTCAVAKALDIDPGRMNPNGGAVAHGHPVGATGAILTVKALYELQRTGGRFGLVTLCIGGGQGIAMVLEAA